MKEPIAVFRVTGGAEGPEAEARVASPRARAAREPAAERPLAAAQQTPPAALGFDHFVLAGVVSERESGRPLPGLVVRAFDKDLMSDDYLGSAATDATGRYEVRFSGEAFRDLFERHPDLYVRVFSAEGRELCSTEDCVRWNAGAVERLDVGVPRERLGQA